MEKADALKMLAEFKARGCHLLIPTTLHLDNLSDQFAVIIETTLLSGYPKDRDVYPHENGTYNYTEEKWKNENADNKVRIAKQGLNKLNILSGIIWSPSLCREIRDPDHRNRIAYEAVGGVRKPDGTPYFIPKLYAMDLDIEEEKLRSQYKGKQNADYLVNRDLLQKKSNIAALCESGAKNRVTRELLCLEEPYTTKTLEKEFVMVRIIPKLDLTDEYTKRRLIDIQLAAMSGIFGMNLPAPEPDRRMIEHAAPIDINLVKESAQDEQPPPPSEPGNGDGAKTYKLEPQDMGNKPPDPVETFKRCSPEVQADQIKILAEKKGYNLTGWLTQAKRLAVENVREDRRIQLFAHLLSLPEKDGTPGKVEADDDVPFA